MKNQISRYLTTKLRKFTLALAIVCGASFAAQAQPFYCLEGLTDQNMFSKTYEGWIGMDAVEITNVNGKAIGYIMAGASSFQATGSTGYSALVRTDLDGNVIDYKAYILDQVFQYRAYSVVQTFNAAGSPTGFAFVASKNQASVFNQGGPQTKIIQVDNGLNVVWERTYKGENKDAFSDLIVDGDRNLVAVGHTKSEGHGGYDILITKISENGQAIWSHTYGANKHEFGYDIIEDKLGGYAVTGATSHLNGRAPLLLHVADNGSMDYLRYYKDQFSTSTINGFALTQTKTGFAITGAVGVVNQLNTVNPFLIVTDANGAFLSGHNYTSSADNGIGVGIRFYQPSQSCPAEYFISGAWESEAYTMKTDGANVNAWRQIINPNPTPGGFDPVYNNAINGVSYTKGNGFLMTGRANHGIWLVKTGSYGYRYGCLTGETPVPDSENLFPYPATYSIVTTEMGGLPIVAKPAAPFDWAYSETEHCFIKPQKDERLKTANIVEGLEEAGLSIFPNPNNGRFNISLDAEATEAQEIKVFSLAGQLVAELSLEAGQTQEVNVEHLSKGLYIARTSTGQTMKISVK